MALTTLCCDAPGRITARSISSGGATVIPRSLALRSVVSAIVSASSAFGALSRSVRVWFADATKPCSNVAVPSRPGKKTPMPPTSALSLSASDAFFGSAR